MEQLRCRDNFSKESLELIWHSRLLKDYPNLNGEKRQSIIRWLLGKNLDCFEQLKPRQLAIAQQMMDYRYQILQQRYLDIEPRQAYCNLINRLGLLVRLCPKIRTWMSEDRKRQKAVFHLIQKTIEQILKGDRNLQQQIAWINQFTPDSGLRNALLLSSLEEYCSQPICHQPLLARRIIELLP